MRLIQDLEISNFKCFKEVHLRDLGRFNVIVGRNGGGKTAFLEALFVLASGGPQPVLKIRHLRGLGEKTSISADPGSFHSLWRDFFLTSTRHPRSNCERVEPTKTRAL